MPDVHALLAEATARTPHPDPVTAVHRTVRRRAHRTQAGVAAGTTFAVATVGVAFATTSHRGAPVPVPPLATTSPSPSATSTATAEWDLERAQRIDRLLKAHPDVFLGQFGSTSMGDGDGTVIHVVFAPGADREAWRDDVDAAADGAAWQEESCPQTREQFDALMADVDAFTWPSGRKPVDPAYLDASSCKVEVYMPTHTVSPADTAAARARWGDEVVVLNT